MTHQLFIPGPPPTVTAQQRGVRVVPHKGRHLPVFYEKPELKKARQFYSSQIEYCRTPYHGSVRVSIEFSWPFRKAEPKRKRQKGWIWKNTRPDVENSAKMLIDLLTSKNFWSDDAAIAHLTLTKKWADEPGTRIRIWALEGPDGMPLWEDRNTQDQS